MWPRNLPDLPRDVAQRLGVATYKGVFQTVRHDVAIHWLDSRIYYLSFNRYTGATDYSYCDR